MAHVIKDVSSAAVSITYPSATYPAPPQYSATSGPDGIAGRTRAQNGWAFFTSRFHLILPRGYKPRKGIIAVHGANNEALDILDGDTWGDYPYAIADALGYAILVPDIGQASLNNPLSMAALDAAYTYLTTTVLGAAGSAVGLAGSSMGGMTVLQWTKRNPSLVAAVAGLAPGIDFDSGHTSVGWSPPYSIAVTDPNYDLYPNWPLSEAPNAPAYDYAYLVSNPTFNNGPTPYDANEWNTNVVSKGWADTVRQPEAWRGLGVPIRLWKAVRDNNSPYQANQWWVRAVNDPLVTMADLLIITGAGHQAWTWGTRDTNHQPNGATDADIHAAGGLPRYELVDFFAEHLG